MAFLFLRETLTLGDKKRRLLWGISSREILFQENLNLDREAEKETGLSFPLQ
jgi:hypothetical protein